MIVWTGLVGVDESAIILKYGWQNQREMKYWQVHRQEQIDDW
jgi:hypothetical protein